MAHIPDVVQAMDNWIQREPQRHHHVINTGLHGIMEAHRNPEIKSIFNSAALLAPDGILTILIARLRGHRLRKSETGPELLQKFCRVAQDKGYRVYFYGDTQETLDQLKSVIAAEYPNVQVVGSNAPPFRELTPEEDEAIIGDINRSKPDVVWVGLGMPKQEQWIYAHRQSVQAPVMVGAGAALKFMGGSVERAPVRVQNLGLEWLWRLYQEPKRVWRRVFIDAPQYVVLALLETTGLKRF